jgi:hypothetical protein
MEVLYTDRTFKTKKALVEAVKAGQVVTVYSASMFGNGTAPDGKQALCGPGPYDRKWYAEITVEGGCITSIK